MIVPGRFVLDTNVIVSGVLQPESAPRRAMLEAQQRGQLLASQDTLDELQNVLSRSRFDRLASAAKRAQLFDEYLANVELILVVSPIRACRDPRDDKFLALAYDGRADALITGDDDLLALHPFHGIAILSPTDYLEKP
uniref:PIN domain-containing protein n=1 Tax=mine drainage metagenome TaxID=410659 RepID=E6QKD2_9ZZZZ